jgi:hypothetical protein
MIFDTIKKISLKYDQYPIAVALSLASTFLGLFREFLLIYIFGFGKINDMLQIYLSLYFAICLLADPVRLVYLNLIDLRYFRQIVIYLAIVVFFIMSTLAVIMWNMRSELSFSLLGLAAFDGFLAVLSSLFIFHKQRFGAGLSAQLVAVIPNFILIPVVIAIGLIPYTNYILIFLLAFMFIHIVQLILLKFISIECNEGNKEDLKGVDLMCFARHFISTLGDQFFQIGIRLIFLQIGDGFVTLLSLFIKCLTTAKNSVVDSFIGAKIGSWNVPSTINSFHQVFGNKMINTLTLVLVFSLCCLDRKNIFFMSFQLFFVLLIAFYLSAKYRIVYFRINHHIHYAGLVVFTGIFDLCCAFLVYFLSQIDGISHAMLFLFFWYVMRLVVENSVLERYYKKLQLHWQKNKYPLADGYQ